MMKIKKLESGFYQILGEDGDWAIVENLVALSDEVVDAEDNPQQSPQPDKPSKKNEEKQQPEQEEQQAEQEKSTEESPDDFYTWEELEALDRDELEDLIDEEDLDIDPDEYKSTKKLRRAIAEELGVDED